MSTAPEIAVGTYLRALHGTKTTPVFLPADEEASWSWVTGRCKKTSPHKVFIL